MMKFVNPKDFKEEDMPIIVLCDDLRGFLGWAIKAHGSGNYNHAMTLYSPNELASQDFGGFKSRKIQDFMKPGIMLKFWRVKSMKDIERLIVIWNLRNRLALPWWKKTYDYAGVMLGQLFNIRWLQNPWNLYCSEQVKVDCLDSIEAIKNIKFGRPSPSDLDRIFKQYPEHFECLGYFLNED